MFHINSKMSKIGNFVVRLCSIVAKAILGSATRGCNKERYFTVVPMCGLGPPPSGHKTN